MVAEVRYCTTEDGVRIAYSVEGEGAPFVWIPGATQVGRLVGGAPGAPIALAQRWSRLFTVALYDARGFGLSPAQSPDLSLGARLSDLDAVVSAVGGGRVILRGMADAAGVAIAYAATKPQNVRGLVLFGSFASGRALASLRPGMHEALIALLKADPSLGTKALTTLMSGQSLPGSGDEVVSVETLTLILEAVQALEVTEYPSVVEAPTLVNHGRDDAGIPVELGRTVASAIPNARLFEYDGPHTPSNKQIVDDVTAVIGEFLSVAAPLDERSPTDAHPALRIVLFTDLVAHTEMMSRLGDEKGRDVLREHERITREVLRAHGGTEVKTMGDGFMASFGSVTKAVECAVALQKAFAERTSKEPLSVRVGLNAGEPIEEDGDLFGAAVILASRIAAKAEGGEILVADTVRGLCSGKGFLFSDRGEFVAKGFEEPVRVYEIGWKD